MTRLRSEFEIVQHDLPVFEAGLQGSFDRFGLLHDLLHHEVLVASFFGHGDAQIHVCRLQGQRRLVFREQGDAFRRDPGILSVFQIDRFSRVAHQGGDVGGEHVEAFAYAQDERAVLLDREQGVRMVAARDGQGVGSLDPVERLLDGLLEIAGIVLFQQVGDRLRVRLALEHITVGNKLLAQGKVVFYNPVVNYGKAPVIGKVRMRVYISRRAVSCPARMTYSRKAGNCGAVISLLAELCYPSAYLINADSSLVDNGYAG